MHKEKEFPPSVIDTSTQRAPHDLFELFFDDEVIKLLVQYSNQYHYEKNHENPMITEGEMRCFFGILILSGYSQLPSKKHYWSNSDDIGNRLVQNAMRRDRFTKILHCLHCTDSTSFNKQDRMWKLRPLIEMLKVRFKEHHVPKEHYNFDESMVKYFGRHPCKQFIRGKPIRFGFKNWCMNAEDGYLVDFEIYCGKQDETKNNYQKAFGKPAAVFAEMVDNMKDPHLPYSFYFDNLFSSVNLISHLTEKGYGGTGTMRVNRVPKDCKFPEMKKSKRGTTESRISNDNIQIVYWKDNSVVKIVSNKFGVQPLSKVSRYCSVEKKKINFPCPAVISEYNKYMGGTDRMDEDVGKYRIGIRSKKWYFTLITYLIDVAINNAWILSKIYANDFIPITSNLEFRRALVLHYLTAHSTERKPAGVSPCIHINTRFDNMGHLIRTIPENKRRRCQGLRCKGSVTTYCPKCNVGLCVKCFFNYHTISN